MTPKNGTLPSRETKQQQQQKKIELPRKINSSASNHQ